MLLDFIVITESVLIPSNPKVFMHSANVLLIDGIIMKIHFLLRTPGMPLRDPWRSLLPILRSLTDQSPKLVFQYKIPPLCFPVELPWSDSDKKVGHFTETIVTVEDIFERSKLHISLKLEHIFAQNQDKTLFQRNYSTYCT